MVSEFCPFIFKILEQFSLDRETIKEQVKAFWYMQFGTKNKYKNYGKTGKETDLKINRPPSTRGLD